MANAQKLNDALLNETLVALLLPICRRLLAGGLGTSDFVGAAKQAYVRAAVDHVVSSGSRVSVSHLSVVTGLTRKEIASLLNDAQGDLGVRRRELKEQRAMRVLRGWKFDPRFCHNDGTPAELPLRGDRRSFSALVKLYGGDVTPNSVLKELERLRAVVLSRSHRLRLRPSNVGGKSTVHLTELARLLPDFANTVSPDSPPLGRPLFFGFKDSVLDSSEQAAKFQQTFSSRALAMLQSVQQWLVSQGQDMPKILATQGKRVRVGIGVYLVQHPEPVKQFRSRFRSKGALPKRQSRAKPHRPP